VPVIDVRDLVIRYGSKTAVDGLNLTVEPGEVVGLLGGNGAGKSSTLRAIAGVNPPTGGTLLVAGHDMGDTRAVERARQAVGYCPDMGGLLRQNTVREHIDLALTLRGTRHLQAEAMTLVERLGLLDKVDQVTVGFSHGECRRLSVLLATLTAEQVLVLDEPFDGVDPLGVEVTVAAVAHAKSQGLGVLISTHLLDLLVASCDRVAVMVGGRAVDGDVAAAFAGPEGKERYAAHLRARQ
jgi:ABC-2 type transport system ATP-binding protein